MMMSPMVPGGQMPGMGYDQYPRMRAPGLPPGLAQMQALPPGLARMDALPPGLARMQQGGPIQLPVAPPRFPTPGRMDGMRERKMAEPRGPMMPMMQMPAMGPYGA